MCLFPIFLSVKAAQAATAIPIAVGVPLAHLPARTDFPAKDILDSILTLPVILPPTVLGYYLLVVIGNASPIGRFIQEDLGKTLSGRFSFDYRLAKKTTPLPLQTKKRGRSSKVVIDNESSDFYTVIEVYTNDRPGLLYSLARTLFDMGLDIRSAKISTKVDQVVDVFYVRDIYGQKIYHPEQCEEVKKALLFKIEGDKKTG
ncbi:MAG: hypothetical protein D4R73_00725 [Deltaproteobacteria bacterium]|nr:MAG: hypothetical protein D4R73_00725 [Deltaproteobacteria bacterium]